MLSNKNHHYILATVATARQCNEMQQSNGASKMNQKVAMSIFLMPIQK